jgi:hypothetical protein
MKYNIDNKTFLITTIALVSIIIGQWFWFGYSSPTVEDKKIEAIHSFIDKISDSYVQEIKDLVQKTKIPSWGCGPSSYALAKIIDDKFFKNQLNIDVIYNNDPYEIIQRFGLVQFDENGQKIIGDHAWIEIYFKNKILFIDPTISQYHRSDGIVFEVFNIGDPTIKTYLNQKYGIIDNLISILLRKVEYRIPIDQEPYPGYSIDPQYIEYYKTINEIRNTVSLGREPVAWKDWIYYLTSHYKDR